MLRRSTIPFLLASAMLLSIHLQPSMAATESSSKKTSTTAKKKSTTGTAKKKAPAVDADTDAGASSGSKKSSNLDLPLPKAKSAGNVEETKTASPEKKSGVTSKGNESAPKPAEKADAEKSNAEKEKKQVQGTPPEDKPPGTAAVDPATKREHAPNATVEPETITEFSAQPQRIQQLMRDAIDLTRLNLTYTFGSADPDKGGMDCSGTMFYLLHAHGFTEVPRDSSGQYLWARKTGAFFPVVSKSAESPEFSELRPGDLMFWTGTYDTQREVPISHVMLYLGREKGSGKRIMFGASDGRSYNGVQRWGVSVFDFKMPKADPANPEKAKVDFVGYARIPGLRSGAETVAAAADEAPPKVSEKAATEGEPKSKPTSVAADNTAKPRTKSSASDEKPKTTSKSSSGSAKKKGTAASRKKD